jgi:hypothetical protein
VKFYDHVNHITATGRQATLYEMIFSIHLPDDMYFTASISKDDVYSIHYNPSRRMIVARHPKATHVDVVASVLEAVILLLTGEHAYLEEDE